MNEFTPSGITEETPKNTLFGAGIVCKGLFFGDHYTVTKDTTMQSSKTYYTKSAVSGQAETFTAATEKEFSDSKTYYEKYTGWNAAETVIGATKGGTKLTITPEFADIEPDGATVKVKGLSVKTGETAKLETNLLEVTEDVIRDVVVGLKNAKELTTSGESGTTYTEIVSTPDLSDENYVENLAFVGKRLDGRKVIVLFETALCTSGFDLDFKNKDSSTLKAVFECYADLTDDPTKLPYHVYVQNYVQN